MVEHRHEGPQPVCTNGACQQRSHYSHDGDVAVTAWQTGHFVTRAYKVNRRGRGPVPSRWERGFENKVRNMAKCQEGRGGIIITIISHPSGVIRGRWGDRVQGDMARGEWSRVECIPSEWSDLAPGVWGVGVGGASSHPQSPSCEGALWLAAWAGDRGASIEWLEWWTRKARTRNRRRAYVAYLPLPSLPPARFLPT